MNACLLVSILALGQQSGSLVDMFDSASKDFGQVPRGTVNVHRFTFTNKTGQPAHISGVRSSCVCATPRIVNSDAKPGEQIVIEVSYNTTTFVGPRSMSIYVSFDAPTLETVTLRVSGYSRSDVTFSPSLVDFGIVENKASAKKSVRIDYAGSQDWRIKELVPNSRFDVNYREVLRESGRSSYELDIAVNDKLSPGNYAEAIQIVTNDPQSPIVKIQTQAIVEAELSAYPSSVIVENGKVGEKITKQVLVRGKESFALNEVAGDIAGLEIKCSEGSRKAHTLQIEMTPSKAGRSEFRILFKTDKPGRELTLPLTVIASP